MRSIADRLNDHNTWLTTHGAGGRRLVEHGSALEGVDLSCVHLIQADLTGARIRRTDISHAALTGTLLMGADLEGSDLSWANMCGAYLMDANLRDTYLRDADMSSACLSGADLAGSRMTQVDLDHSVFDGTEDVHYELFRGYQVIVGPGPVMCFGCIRLSFDEWDKQHGQLAEQHELSHQRTYAAATRRLVAEARVRQQHQPKRRLTWNRDT